MQLLAVVRDAFHTPSTRAFRVVEAVSGTLIAISVLLLGLELWRPLWYWQSPWTRIIDRVVLVVFAFELVARVATWHPPGLRVLALSPAGRVRAHVLGRLRYLLQPLMLIDLFTVLGAVPGLRGLRAIRLLRLFRGLPILKYANPF